MTMLAQLKQIWQSKRALFLSAAIGLVIGAVLLSLTVKLWWVVAVVLLVGMVAIWQVPRVRGCLPGQPSTYVTDHSLRYWWWRVLVVLALIASVMIGQAYWWTTTTRYQDRISGYDSEKDIVIERDGEWHALPIDYLWQKLQWDLGITPLPDLVTIPAGSFERSDGETQQRVEIANAFLMSAHEITFAEYDYYVWRMQEAGADPEVVRYPHDEGWGRGTRPVIKVNWSDAKGYANWFSKQVDMHCRLPSEAEWEYVARAGTTTNYFWGDDIGKNNANCGGCGSQWDGKQTAPVASFKPNNWGLYDMHGNVWEWTQDRWHSNYQDAQIDGSAWEAGDNTRRVVRGGSWDYEPNFVRSAFRLNYLFPDLRFEYGGFRVMCSLPHSRTWAVIHSGNEIYDLRSPFPFIHPRGFSKRNEQSETSKQ